MTTISKKFAHLPNGIIRHIVSYTGATFKKRNGKYMRQIPEDDPRYDILNTIPKKRLTYAPYTEHLPWSYTTNFVEMKRESRKSDCYMTFCVSIKTYPQEGHEYIRYYHIIQNEHTGERRRYVHRVDYQI